MHQKRHFSLRKIVCSEWLKCKSTKMMTVVPFLIYTNVPLNKGQSNNTKCMFLLNVVSHFSFYIENLLDPPLAISWILAKSDRVDLIQIFLLRNIPMHSLSKTLHFHVFLPIVTSFWKPSRSLTASALSSLKWGCRHVGQSSESPLAY